MNPNLILSIISGEASAAAKRARRSAVEYIIAGIAALIGFGFLLLAAFVYTAHFYDELTVAIAFGAFFLVVAAALLIYHRISARARARRAKERMSREAITLAASLGLAILPSLMSKRGVIASLALPVLSALAYAIYKENAGSEDKPDRDQDA